MSYYHAMSLSIWPPQLKQPPSADPTEKHRSPLIRPDLINAEELSMENRQLMEVDTDGEAYLCVNPYEVNPIPESSPLLSEDVFIAPQKGEFNVTQQHCSATSGRGFYESIKLEMEEFGDISSFLLPRPMFTNPADELTTPTFEYKDGFDFGLFNYQTRIQPHSTVKVERDAAYRNTYASPSEKHKDIFYGTEVPRDDNITSEIGNIDNLGGAEVYSPASDNGTYIYNETTVTDSVNDSALSVNSYSLSPEGVGYVVQGLDTPEDSNSSGCSSEKGRKLSLDMGLKAPMKEPISTPNIIEEVVDLEDANFNILSLINEDNISVVTSDDIFRTSPAFLPSAKTPSAKFLSKCSAREIPAKQPRKRRKQVDDDDEEYTPPTKKFSTHHRRSVKVLQEDSDSDSNSESVFSNSRPRGRPPKRTNSVTSEGSREGEGSKYRELRDKNNEASRKSRQKRKIKELELEKEADELRSRNIKLKAQVEELQKMVDNFRDNLFKIMLLRK
ncbi:unnamed protein product [Phaedon cochleariae]|uniref:BZIP domain-containing protein n=1 Tax=Phaedon cochleariae TaxID=80249 RepID=A0A9P0GQ68_PHACE|nr:unnamed protein product [Phaedon cochleariae]